MTVIIVLTSIFLLIYFFIRQPQFGKLPSGERLRRIESSPNYKDGKFQNLSFTPDLAEGETYFNVIKKVLFEKDKRNKPTDKIPTQKTNLLNLNPDENVMVWFGLVTRLILFRLTERKSL